MQVRKITWALLCMMMLAVPLSSSAQRPARDKEKEKQWKSMENGPWDFAPDWYYYFLHNKYSGAEMYWKWAGFNSGFRVRFKEKDSNVKRIMPTRVTAEETQRQKVKKVEEERNESTSRNYTRKSWSVRLTGRLIWPTLPTRTSLTVCRVALRTGFSTV